MRDGGAPDGAPAEPAQRLAARVVDTLVVGLPVTLVTTSEPLGLPPATAETLTAPILAGLLLVYETVQLALWGRTLGKRLVGLRVRSEDGAGAGPGVGHAALRATVYAAPIAMQPIPLLGPVMGVLWVGNALLTLREPRRPLHDRLAGTVVAAAP
ncbi:RDD family protein [Thermomonospora catenispora]|uniref:RDD family protein n=1 Tax=Thermomonospora catenispora TaxID=2493090 RepID=UPI0011209BDB|nr:RDD family protein [Thermomonospora catenispora]TNY35306.1 RDD family protein [Thermomonospora catenispora]